MKKLHGNMSVVRGYREIVDHCLKQARAHESGVMRGSDPESVHDMRVGLRRLATAVDLFEPVFPLPLSLQAELDWIRKKLGEARDWEVLVFDTLTDALRASPGEPALDSLLQAGRIAALSKRKKAAFAVGSARYRKFVEDMAEWSGRIGDNPSALPAGQENAQMPLQDFAGATLVRRHRKLRRRMRNLHLADAPARHRVRIAAKKARYAAEFFGPLFPRAKVRSYVAALTAMQDVLGGLNDVSVAQELMRRIEKTQPELVYAAGFLEGYLKAGVPDSLRKLQKRAAEFEQVKLPTNRRRTPRISTLARQG